MVSLVQQNKVCSLSLHKCYYLGGKEGESIADDLILGLDDTFKAMLITP